MSVVARVLIAPIRFYQRFISPALPATCRYYPTCSAYAVTALREHGALRGTWLAVKRLGRCHPWHEGGIDHVPPRRPSRRERRAAVGSSVSGASIASPASGSNGSLSVDRAGTTAPAPAGGVELGSTAA
jgi:uncharacterized protein